MKAIFFLWWKRERYLISLFWKTIFLILDKVTLPYVVVLFGGMAAALYWDYMIYDTSWLNPIYGLLFWLGLFLWIGRGRYTLSYEAADEAFLFTVPLPAAWMGYLSGLLQWMRALFFLLLFFFLLSPAFHELYGWDWLTSLRLSVLFFFLSIISLNLFWMLYGLAPLLRRIGEWFLTLLFVPVATAWIFLALTHSKALTQGMLHPISIWIGMILMLLSTYGAIRTPIKDPTGMIDQMMRRRLGLLFFIYGEEMQRTRARKKPLFFKHWRFNLPFSPKGGMVEMVWKISIRRKLLWYDLLKMVGLAILILWQVKVPFVQFVTLLFMMVILIDIMTSSFRRKDDFWLAILPMDQEAKGGLISGITTLLMGPLIVTSFVMLPAGFPWYALPAVWIFGYLFTNQAVLWKMRGTGGQV